MLSLSPDVVILVQFDPLNHCQLPWLALLARLPTTTTAARLLADDPSVMASLTSEKLPLNRSFTVAPLMVVSVVSSLILARVALPLATGASLIAVMVVVRLTVFALIWLLPPLLELLIRVAFAGVLAPVSTNLVVSGPGLPLNWLVGTKRIQLLASR